MNTIEDYLKLLSAKVNDNIEIITPNDLGQNFFLHITKDNLKKPYIPFISRRSSNQEDNTTPRVTVSDYLLGCITGYASFFNDAFYIENGQRRGVYINAIPFEYALKPNNKLVYDQSISNEHWLVPYNEDNKEYTFDRIGKMFISNASIKMDNSKLMKTVTYDVYIEITKDEGVKFSSKIFLKKGYYYIQNIDNNNLSYKGNKEIIVSDIDKSEFMNQKNISASLLSHVEKPLVIKW